MRVDKNRSAYWEDPDVENLDYSREELRYLRQVLRRLRFLEKQIIDRGSTDATGGGGLYATLERDALEWLLREIEYLDERRLAAFRTVSGNHARVGT